jgi:peptide/nickel transport system permease protein
VSGISGRFLLRRVAASAVLILVVSLGSFVLVRLAPGDAGDIAKARGASVEEVARVRAELGLDRSLAGQLGLWLNGLLHFDLGPSANFGLPVGELIRLRAPNTAELGGAALILATVVGLPLGLLTGAYPRSVLARLVTACSIALVACPPVIATLALMLLALHRHWLSLEAGALALPALALALPLAAMLERLQSQATSEVLSAADLAAARARGIPPRRLLLVHGGRQALRPVLGVYGILIGTIFSGSLLVEALTNWPGLGLLMKEALAGRDIFLVAGCALAGAVFLALGNLLADLARALVDPRVRDIS